MALSTFTLLHNHHHHLSFKAFKQPKIPLIFTQFSKLRLVKTTHKPQSYTQQLIMIQKKIISVKKSHLNTVSANKGYDGRHLSSA